MPFTEQQKQENERRMFGCTLAEFKAGCHMAELSSPFDLVRLSQGLQSDAQELIAMGDLELARQRLNLSKALLDDVARALRAVV